MSSTHSSQPSSSRSTRREALRELVAERAGKQWCLFLDRDGVVNRRIVGDYVRHWGQFEWLPNAAQALRLLKEWAPHLVVVTNQQGVGKGLVGAESLEVIHQNIVTGTSSSSSVVPEFEVCPHLESAQCRCRKPKPGLVLDWLHRHPNVNPALSIMAGDSRGDLEMAHNVESAVGGCAGIQIGIADLGVRYDAMFESLWDFAVAVDEVRREKIG